MNTLKDYITIEEAYRELGEQALYTFLKWLRQKGYSNLESVDENQYRQTKLATRDQLAEFIKEVSAEFKGEQTLNGLWGQTREYFNKKR